MPGCAAYHRGMPRLTPQRRAMRREQVLSAAVRVVIRSGYQGLTMADVVAESGLSTGAVYGYFDSREALLAAVADKQFGRLGALLDGFLAADPSAPPPGPAEVVRALAEVVDALRSTPEGDLAVVAVQVWGEAVRGGTVAEIMHARIGQLESRLIRVAQRWLDAGVVPAGTDPRHVARVVLAMLPGYLLQSLILGPIPPTDFAAGLAALIGPRRPTS